VAGDGPFPFASLRSQVDATARQARELTGALSASQLAWSPPEGGWSVGQCLEHLIVVADRYEARLIRGLDEAHARLDAPYLGGHKPTWLGRLFIDAVKPANTRRFKAPKIFLPPPRPRPDVAREFCRRQARLGELLERAKGIDLSATRIRSPITPLIRFNLGDALEILIYHAQRHLNQATRVTDHPEFPDA
jgi:hypothetical protein